jgi:hypothetical protein
MSILNILGDIFVFLSMNDYFFSRSISHLEHLSALSDVISGCIGQVYAAFAGFSDFLSLLQQDFFSPSAGVVAQQLPAWHCLQQSLLQLSAVQQSFLSQHFPSLHFFSPAAWQSLPSQQDPLSHREQQSFLQHISLEQHAPSFLQQFLQAEAMNTVATVMITTVRIGINFLLIIPIEFLSS